MTPRSGSTAGRRRLFNAGLVLMDADNRPQPYLAEKWSLAEDGKSLTLNLRKDAVFHDGKPVTSADVAFSIMAIKANHPFTTMMGPVEKVDTPDPYTAIIRMSTPHPAICSRAAVAGSRARITAAASRRSSRVAATTARSSSGPRRWRKRSRSA